MANIKVTLNYEITDGQSLTFKAPCDGNAVTGLIIYYPLITEDASTATSKTFVFRDAHGNILTSMNNLFMTGVYVQVILDTTNGYAYIQNADTNGYIEDRFNHVIQPQIVVTASTGSTVKATKDGVDYTGTEDNGVWTINVPEYGTYTVTGTNESNTVTETVIVTEVKQYPITIKYFSAILQVTSDAGATVTATNGTKRFTDTIPSGGVLSMNITSAGTYAVTVTKNGKSSGAMPVDITTNASTYTVECALFYPILADNSWTEIKQASSSGQAPYLWSVGDEIDIAIGSKTYTFVILDFNHDLTWDGTKAGITFGLKNLMTTTYTMGETNNLGYKESVIDKLLNDTSSSTCILNLLPSDLTTNIGKACKKWDSGNSSGFVNGMYTRYLFIFSETEIFGTSTCSTADQGSQYSYFVNESNRKKYLSNGEGNLSGWWTRTSFSASTTMFCAASSSGELLCTRADTSLGVCFGFCI